MPVQELKDADYFIKILRQHLPELREKYSVNYLGIFGSYIRGEQTKDSDLDVLVQFDKKPGLLKYIELENYLSDLLEVKVDLVMKSALKPNIGKRILNEVKALLK
ncbi:MAG: nucleotidyltransferase family protein [Methanosarcina sp.]|nr:DNA polymerase III subunit beta [Methanosarcina sp. Ant1]